MAVFCQSGLDSTHSWEPSVTEVCENGFFPSQSPEKAKTGQMSDGTGCVGHKASAWAACRSQIPPSCSVQRMAPILPLAPGTVSSKPEINQPRKAERVCEGGGQCPRDPSGFNQNSSRRSIGAL